MFDKCFLERCLDKTPLHILEGILSKQTPFSRTKPRLSSRLGWLHNMDFAITPVID